VAHRWDIIEFILNEPAEEEGVESQVDDLIGYLLLVKQEIAERRRLRAVARANDAGLEVIPDKFLDSGDPDAIAAMRRRSRVPSP
jgi:hypothetical protein